MSAAIKKCKNCYADIDGRANVCPHCSAKQGMPLGLKLFLVFIGVAALMSVSNWFSAPPKPAPVSDKTAARPANKPKQKPKPAAPKTNAIGPALEDYRNLLTGSGLIPDVISRVEADQQGTVKIYVQDGWHYLPKVTRKDYAQSLWKGWAKFYAPENPDLARISIRSLGGSEVGGSRWIAGSAIWVDES